MRALLVVLVPLLCSCRRTEPVPVSLDAPSTTPSTTPSIASTAPTVSSASALDDKCVKHADCEPILVFVDGDARCCPAPTPQAAAVVTAASAFLASCAELRKNRDCPVPEKVTPLRAACIGGHCVLAP